VFVECFEDTVPDLSLLCACALALLDDKGALQSVLFWYLHELEEREREREKKKKKKKKRRASETFVRNHHHHRDEIMMFQLPFETK
jgi:hypothetical protein